MRKVNIQEAKKHFLELIEAVQLGGSIVIAKAGKPVAKLAPIREKPKRRFGVLKGKLEISDDFDAPLLESSFFFPASISEC